MSGVFKHRGIVLALVLVGLSLATATEAIAQSSWAVALRDDDQLVSFVTRAAAASGSAPGAAEAGAVVAYKQHFYEIARGGYRLCQNFVVRVNDPSAIDAYVTDPYLQAKGELTQVAAFRVRGGKLRRLYGKEVSKTPGDGEILRAQAHFGFGKLKAGDLIGWSAITKIDEPLQVARVAAADRFPVAWASLRVRAAGYQTYTILSRSVDPADFTSEVDAETNYKPSAWKAHVKNVAAVPGLPINPPFAHDVPTFLVVHTESYVQIPNIAEGWAPSTGWWNVATLLSGLKEYALTESARADSIANLITRDSSTDTEKERTIYEFLRDQLVVLESDAYDTRGLRSPERIVADRKATPFEKALLMMDMLNTIGIESELAGVREERWGEFDDELRSYHQFQHVVVRTGEDEPRFYVPFDADGEPGSLDPEWGTCLVLSPTVDLMEKAYDYNVKVYNKITQLQQDDPQSIDPAIPPTRAEEKAVEQDWYRIERVNGSTVQ